MKKIIAILILFIGITTNLADDVSEYMKKQNREIASYKQQEKREIKKQKQEFIHYLAQSRSEFDSWNTQRKKELQEFKKEIKREWGSFIEPTNKIWVEYSKDRGSVSSVDFEKGQAAVSVLVKADDSREHITEQIVKAVTRAITSKGSNRSKPVEVEKSKQQLLEPILNKQVIDKQGLIVTVDRVSKFAQGLVEEAKKTIVKIPVPGKTAERMKVQVKFNLAPNHLQKRAKQFMPYIDKFCTKYDISKARVLATIHTESHFNPMAVSSANAIGLMQLVPVYGAQEAYKFVYGAKAIPREHYLYDPENNIELGCAYIYLLKNRYFSSVDDTNSTRFCTIAAYNTGPKNVARAFIGEKSLKRAIPVINKMESSQEVYNHLIVRLPYAETRHYLAEVTERMRLYK